MTFKEGEIHASHFDSWQNLLNIAEKSIDIGSFYWTLRGNDTGRVFPSSWKVGIPSPYFLLNQVSEE